MTGYRSSRSADATMATWGGSTQISAESYQDHTREGRSGVQAGNCTVKPPLSAYSHHLELNGEYSLVDNMCVF